MPDSWLRRRTPVTHWLSWAFQAHVDDPWRMLAIAVVTLAYCDGQPVDERWCDLAEIDPEVYGVEVC